MTSIKVDNPDGATDVSTDIPVRSRVSEGEVEEHLSFDDQGGGGRVEPGEVVVACDECRRQNKICKNSNSNDGGCELCKTYDQPCTVTIGDVEYDELDMDSSNSTPKSGGNGNIRCLHCKTVGAKCKASDPKVPNGPCRRCTQQGLECLRFPKDGRWYRWHPDEGPLAGANAEGSQGENLSGKRVRSSVACLNCKSSKRKCEILPAQGTCTNCLKSNLECKISPTNGRWKRWHQDTPPPDSSLPAIIIENKTHSSATQSQPASMSKVEIQHKFQTQNPNQNQNTASTSTLLIDNGMKDNGIGKVYSVHNSSPSLSALEKSVEGNNVDVHPGVSRGVVEGALADLRKVMNSTNSQVLGVPSASTPTVEDPYSTSAGGGEEEINELAFIPYQRHPTTYSFSTTQNESSQSQIAKKNPVPHPQPQPHPPTTSMQGGPPTQPQQGQGQGISFMNYTVTLELGKPVLQQVVSGGKNAYSTNCDFCKRRKKKCERSPDLNGGCEACRKAGVTCTTTPRTSRKQLMAQLQKKNQSEVSRSPLPVPMNMAPDPEEVDVSMSTQEDIPVEGQF